MNQNIYNRFHRETKNKIKYENMLSVGNRFKNVGKKANTIKNEIVMLKNKIAILNDETLKMKNISFQGQNEIDEMIKSVNPEEPDCISFEEFFRVMSKMEI